MPELPEVETTVRGLERVLLGRRIARVEARRADLVRTQHLDDWPPIKALGPEPFDVDPRDLKRRLSGRNAAIKLLLLDQGIVAGLGNIYVCEALYRSGIHPTRPSGSVSLARLRRLVPAIHDVLNEAIAAGGSTLRDFASPDGELGYFSKAFAVYDREGKRCGCGGVVRRIVQGGRSTFYCPQCQR
jgi:formamidopyrimidine-DNA glycosylase